VEYIIYIHIYIVYMYYIIYDDDLLEGEGQVSLHTNKLLTEFKGQIFENRTGTDFWLDT